MKPEFIESELELFVQRILMHEFYTFNSEYQLLKVSPGAEKSLGYDAKIVGLTPFYCQFKTSEYLSSGKRFKKRESYCKTNGWPVRPAYSFGLRRPSDKSLLATPSAWQHNVLHSLWKDSPHAVAYVAPTFHTRLAMHALEPRPSHYCRFCAPTYTAKSHLNINVVSVNGRDRVRLPVFAGLVSIPPHLPVKTLSHDYFYLSHRDVTFHSDPVEVDTASSFGDFLAKNISRALESRTIDNVQDELTKKAIAEKTGLGSDIAHRILSYGASLVENAEGGSQFDRLSPQNKQLAFSYALESFFGISTLALVRIERGI